MLKNFNENVLIAGLSMVMEATFSPVRKIADWVGNMRGGN